MIKVAINGFGRIGRLAFRQIVTQTDFDIVAINDLTSAEDLAYLVKYDTVHGSFHEDEIKAEGNEIVVAGVKRIKVYSETDPANLPWGELGVDLVLECTGKFTAKEDAMKHITAGAKKVLISAPGKGEMKTIVYNVNDSILTNDDVIVSAASCTTNCLAPVAKVLNDNFKIRTGFMSTIHAYTNDQNTLDSPHKKGDLRRARAAASNIVPNSTGAAKAIGLVIPELNGKLDGTAQRVPVVTGSIVELTCVLEDDVTKEEINEAFKKAANVTLGYTEDEIVSSDVIGIRYGSLFDATQTKVIESGGVKLVKVAAWYDNEMSYTSQMIRTAKYLIDIMEE